VGTIYQSILLLRLRSHWRWGLELAARGLHEVAGLGTQAEEVLLRPRLEACPGVVTFWLLIQVLHQRQELRVG